MARSIVYNYLEDDLTIKNYLALTACILNKDLRYNQALKIFDIEHKTNRWKKYNQSRSKKSL